MSRVFMPVVAAVAAAALGVLAAGVWLLLSAAVASVIIALMSALVLALFSQPLGNLLPGNQGAREILACLLLILVPPVAFWITFYYLEVKVVLVEPSSTSTLNIAQGDVFVNAVTWSGSRFVAVGQYQPDGLDAYADGVVWTAEQDGQIWTRSEHDDAVFGAVLGRERPAMRNLLAVTANNGRLVAAGWDTRDDPAGDAAFWDSSDGGTWTLAADPAFTGAGYQGVSAIGGHDGQVVAAIEIDKNLWLLQRTSKESEWSGQLLGSTDSVSVGGIVHGAGTWLAVGRRSNTDPGAGKEFAYDPAVWTSRDGVGWSSDTVSGLAPGAKGAQEMLGVAYLDGYFVAVGRDDRADNGGSNPAVWASRGGETWRRIELPSELAVPGTLYMTGVAATRDKIVIVGQRFTDRWVPALWQARLERREGVVRNPLPRLRGALYALEHNR